MPSQPSHAVKAEPWQGVGAGREPSRAVPAVAWVSGLLRETVAESCPRPAARWVGSGTGPL